MRNRHGWNSWDDYLAVHTRRLRDFEHFVLSDRLGYTTTKTQVFWSGILYCQDGIEINVAKHQDVEHQSGRPAVRTWEYSYHVLRRVGPETFSLFRYDNIHLHRGHADRHHRHRYDDLGGEIEPPVCVEEPGWPTLSEVIAEAEAWWLTWAEQRRQ